MFANAFIWGIGILLFDIALDAFDMWPPLTVIPTVLASLGSFLVGVPVGLILRTTLQREQEEKSRQDDLQALSDSAWNAFAQRVSEFCSDQRIAALKVACNEVADYWAGISQQIGARARFDPETNTSYSGYLALADEDYRYLVAQMPAWADELEPLIQRVSVPGGHVLSVEWVGVQRAWTLLDTYVKIQRFASRLGWLPADLDTRIQHKMLSQGISDLPGVSPLNQFSWIHDSRAGSGFVGMQDVPAFLRQCARLDQIQMSNALRDVQMPLHWIVASRHRATAANGADFLGQEGTQQ